MRSTMPLILVVALAPVPVVRAGLYNTAEPPLTPDADLVQFIDKQLVALRAYGPPDALAAAAAPGGKVHPGREDYLKKVEQLRGKAKLSIQDQANLGAYLIRLRKTNPNGRDYEEALQVLERARREAPRDFHVLANLGTVYQITGQLDAALSCLQEAYQLAPESARVYERYHMQLVQRRLRERLRMGVTPLDELFPVRFVGAGGKWEVSGLAEEEKQKLPSDAVRIVQQLLICLPEDGRLFWLLGEVANARGDIRGAEKAMDEAVYTFRLSMPELKERRLLLQEAKARLPKTSSFPALGESAEPVEYSWQLGWRGWTAIGGGVALGLALIALQIREVRRRRALRT